MTMRHHALRFDDRLRCEDCATETVFLTPCNDSVIRCPPCKQHWERTLAGRASAVFDKIEELMDILTTKVRRSRGRRPVFLIFTLMIATLAAVSFYAGIGSIFIFLHIHLGLISAYIITTVMLVSVLLFIINWLRKP